MEKTYITFEQAKALKELGMPQWNKEESDNSKMAYDCEGELWEIRYFDQNPQDYYSAPSLELAAKWVRENTGIFINVGLCVDFQYQVYLQTTLDKDHNIISSASQHSSYEEALSVGIDKTIEKLNEK